jgi:tetratricopeptide (TPR) repeat protein
MQRSTFAEARKNVEKALELAPNSFPAFTELVALDLAEKTFDAAMARVQARLAKTPASPELIHEEARIHAAQKNWVAAEAALFKAIEIDGDFAPAYGLLGRIYVAGNRQPEGISKLKILLTKKPDNELALMLSGLIYSQMKEHDSARAAYEQVLATKPGNALALNNLAVLYAYQLGQPDRGFALAQKAWDAAPHFGDIADTLGWMFFQRADYQKALPLLRESVRKLPNNAEVQFHFGMVSERAGDLEAARTALRKAVNSPGDLPWKAEAQQRLTELEAKLGDPKPPVDEKPKEN